MVPASIPGRCLKGRCGPIRRWARSGCTCCPGSVSGACLADDMGLGKTIQVLSLLLVQQQRSAPQPSLLVAPASLLANWVAEIKRFAPGLKAKIVHASAMTADELKQFRPEQAAEVRSGDHQLWVAAADSGAGGDRLALCHSGRGAGDQESERQADQSHQGAESPGANRPDRNTG